MSTLVVAAPRPQKPALLVRAFAQLASAVLTALDVFEEAQRQAYAAKQRYPFVAW
ncbi:MAG TPA: hypothetical protein VFA57_15955 [Pseudolabrys sp.]|nr:hypothetical protein [Pseudolabrys sp.]